MTSAHAEQPRGNGTSGRVPQCDKHDLHCLPRSSRCCLQPGAHDSIELPSYYISLSHAPCWTRQEGASANLKCRVGRVVSI